MARQAESESPPSVPVSLVLMLRRCRGQGFLGTLLDILHPFSAVLLSRLLPSTRDNVRGTPLFGKFFSGLGEVNLNPTAPISLLSRSYY